MSETREREALLVAELAHELRNVLTIIAVSIEYLRGVAAGDEEARLTLDDMEAASLRASHIATNLLERAHQVNHEEVHADLGAVITQHTGALRRLAPAGVRVELETGDRPLRVRLAASAADQVLFNLALNAFDAMAERGGVLTVTTRRLPLIGRPGFAELCVNDTGVGMDEPTLRRCFDPFFTTKPGRGTGIGLHAVRDAVERAGGRVTISSPPGAGTSVCVYLPVLEDTP